MIEKAVFAFLVIAVSACAEGVESDVQENSYAEAQAELANLTSPDADVRRTALNQLVGEIQSGVRRTEGHYSAHGKALLPPLTQVIRDLDDRYAVKALEAIHWMGASRLMLEHMDRQDLSEVDRQELDEQMDDISHYPMPSDYPPLKDALINVLDKSPNADARSLAVLTLANGFPSTAETEELFVARLPIEESNYKVQSAVMDALSIVIENRTVKRTTELAVIEGLASTNIATRRAALKILQQHQFEGALEGVIDSLSAVGEAREFDDILSTIAFFNDIEDAHIARLENTLMDVDDEKRKQNLDNAIQLLKYRTTDIQHNFGFLELTQSSILLHTAHRGLAPRTPLAVVGSDLALYVLMPVGTEAAIVEHIRTDSRPTTSYYVGSDASNVTIESIENAVVYFALESTTYTPSTLTHTSCSSGEGIHHSVWWSDGQEKTRVWSAYRYLGYSTESTCSDADLAE